MRVLVSAAALLLAGCGTFVDFNCRGGSPAEIPSYCHRSYAWQVVHHGGKK